MPNAPRDELSQRPQHQLRRSGPLLVCLFFASLALHWTQNLQAAAPAPASEYALKAALLLKLPRFIYFPDKDDDTPTVLCLLGENPFGNTLNRLASASDNGQQLTITPLATTDEASGCHLIFLSQEQMPQLDDTLQTLSAYPAVTVSDGKDFARKGGMVELALNPDGKGLSILVNLKAAQMQNIQFNAQLLRLVRIIEP